MTEIYQEIQLHQKALWEETLTKKWFADSRWFISERGFLLRQKMTTWGKWQSSIHCFLLFRGALLSFIDRENCNNPQVIDWTFNAPFYFGLFSMQLLSKRPKKQRYKCCPQYLQGRIKRYFLHLLHKNFTWHTVRNLM